MTFLVTWTATTTVPTECPDFKPDPYTGQYPMTHCAVYHCKTITEQKSAEFLTKEEADDFIKKAPASCTVFNVRERGILDEDLELSKVYEEYPNVSFTCVAFPAQHEIGCKCGFKKWTRADLLGALLCKKQFEQERVEKLRKAWSQKQVEIL